MSIKDKAVDALDNMKANREADAKRDSLWEMQALKDAAASWKDELFTVAFIVILLAPLVVSESQLQVAVAFYGGLPLWLSGCIGGAVSASFGISVWKKFKR